MIPTRAWLAVYGEVLLQTPVAMLMAAHGPGVGAFVETDRRLRLWGLVVAHAGDAPASVLDVCAVTVAVSGVDAAAVTVVLAATPRETLYTSGRLAADLEDITLTLGERPGMDASAGAVRPSSRISPAPTALSAGPRSRRRR